MASFTFTNTTAAEGNLFANGAFVEPSRENYQIWERIRTGDTVVIAYKSSPLTIATGVVSKRGLAIGEESNSPNDEALLILYLFDMKIAKVDTISAYSISIIDTAKELTKTEYGNYRKICNEPTNLTEHEFDDAFPIQISKEYSVDLCQANKEFNFLKHLAKDHPFGESIGQYSIVLRSEKGLVAGAIIKQGKSTKETHNAEKLLFGRSALFLKQMSIHIARLYSRSKGYEKHKHHLMLIQSVKILSNIIYSRGASYISGVSYDYLPAAVKMGAKVVFPVDPMRSIYYFLPCYVSDETYKYHETDIKLAYRRMRSSRNRSSHWIIRTNTERILLAEDNKMWLLRLSPKNTACWRSIRPGDMVYFSVAGLTIECVAEVSEARREAMPGYERYPLGIHFSRFTRLQQPISIASEQSRRWHQELGRGGIAPLPHDFTAPINETLGDRERKYEMWVSPNPYLLKEKDFTVKRNQVFVVQAWSLIDSVLPTIEEILNKSGFEISHASQRQGQVIFEDIWILMNQSEAVIVDFTDKRPNVYLEFGMAIVLGKPIVAITQNAEDLPTDTKNLKCVIYRSSIEGQRDLSEKLPKALEQTISDFQKIAENEGRSFI